MSFARVYFAVIGGLSLLLPLAGIAYGVIAAYRPELRDRAARVVFSGSATLMLGGSLATLLITRASTTGASQTAFLGLLGGMMLAQGLCWNDLRIRGVIAGIAAIVTGLWWATTWLRPREEVLFQWREQFFIIGELVIILGVVLVIASWQKWRVLQPLEEGDFARRPGSS